MLTDARIAELHRLLDQERATLDSCIRISRNLGWATPEMVKINEDVIERTRKRIAEYRAELGTSLEFPD